LLTIHPMEAIPNHPCPVVDHVMHLGHPLPQGLQETVACELNMDELKRTVTLFHDVPLPSWHRVRLVNTVILPAFLHRSECRWIPAPLQKEIYTLLLSFCLGVGGLSSKTSPKTIHSPPPCGLRLHHFSQQYFTRVLDTIHKAHLYSPLQPQRLDGQPMQPLVTFLSCLKQNLPPVAAPTLDSMVTVPLTMIPPGIQGAECSHTPPHLAPGNAYSDGSYFASSPRAGAPAV
jgi:hypothetical protein